MTLDADGKRLLVVQGGGARAAYSYGAVITFLRSGMGRSIDAVVASSSAALVTAFVLAGQEELVPALFREAFNSRRLIRPWRLARIADVDYLVNHLVRRELQLDIGSLLRSPVQFVIQVTDWETGRPQHFPLADLETEEIWTVFVASAAIPGLFETPVFVRGRRYIDGGVTDPVPLTALLEGGAIDVTGVWTRPLTTTWRHAGWLFNFIAPLIFRTQSHAVRCALRRRDPAYVQAIETCLDGDDRVRCVAPQHARLIASRLARSERAFWRSVRLGVLDMEAALHLPPGSVPIPASVARACGL